MKFFLCTLFLATLALGSSWVMKALNQTDPAHPGKCVFEGLILSPGEEGRPRDRCARIMCEGNGDVEMHGCGKTFTAPPCKVGGPLYPDAPYPDCCEMEIICPDGIKPTSISRTG